jgi:hypothetical protein
VGLKFGSAFEICRESLFAEGFPGDSVDVTAFRVGWWPPHQFPCRRGRAEQTSGVVVFAGERVDTNRRATRGAGAQRRGACA